MNKLCYICAHGTHSDCKCTLERLIRDDGVCRRVLRNEDEGQRVRERCSVCTVPGVALNSFELEGLGIARVFCVNIYTTAVACVQVLRDTIEDSYYKLTSQTDQIRAYVFDVVRSTVPKVRGSLQCFDEANPVYNCVGKCSEYCATVRCHVMQYDSINNHPLYRGNAHCW